MYFHDMWKEAEGEAKELSPDIFDQLQHTECILKLSSLIRSDYGTGRLVLTDRRYCSCTMIVCLREEKNRKKPQL